MFTACLWVHVMLPWCICACLLWFQAGESSSLEALKSCGDVVLGSQLSVALFGQGVWSRWPPEAASNLNRSVIPEITLVSSEYPGALYSLFVCPGKHSCIQMMWKGCQVAVLKLITLQLWKLLEDFGVVSENWFRFGKKKKKENVQYRGHC